VVKIWRLLLISQLQEHEKYSGNPSVKEMSRACLTNPLPSHNPMPGFWCFDEAYTSKWSTEERWRRKHHATTRRFSDLYQSPPDAGSCWKCWSCSQALSLRHRRGDVLVELRECHRMAPVRCFSRHPEPPPAVAIAW
jgi:hypothetical protein